MLEGNSIIDALMTLFVNTITPFLRLKVPIATSNQHREQQTTFSSVKPPFPQSIKLLFRILEECPRK